MPLTKEEKTNEERSEVPEKRPYRSPQLRRLGTVAELTLGGSGSNLDGHNQTKRGN
jgi:hypothetical protein